MAVRRGKLCKKWLVYMLKVIEEPPHFGVGSLDLLDSDAPSFESMFRSRFGSLEVTRSSKLDRVSFQA